ncbi:MAG: hypothetical protein LBU31_04325, partial [Coriobacteriales bacterium]|nr:hypothetical protein [Coriobacteriales bacterium]
MSLESLTFAEHDRLLITPDVFSEQPRFEDILKAKLSFIETGADPTTCVALRPQIAGSWIRCRQMGIEPDRVCLNKEVAPEAYQRICDSNEYLVQTAQPLMHIIEDLHLSHDYIFELLDPSGIALHQLGDFQLHGFIAEHSIFNESTMGTNAHSLCMRHKTSYQVLGPEHYCFALHNLAACAAPILDEHDEVLG